ncbi:MAG: MFS transporter [Caldisphaera sp.]|nr:MAG: MFS transporter [Caldisphaera sp.]
MANNNRPIEYLAMTRILRSISAGMIAIVYPYITIKMLHMSIFTLGLIYASAGFSTAVFSLIFGYFADLLGRKNGLYLSSLLLILSFISLFIKINFSTAVISAVLGGISNTGSMAGGGIGGAFAPVQNTIIADLTSRKNRTTLLSLLSFFGNIAATGGTLLGGVFSYNMEILLALIISIAAFLLIIPMKIPEVKAKEWKIKSTGTTAKFSITGILNGLSSGLITPYLIPFFIMFYDLPRPIMSIYSTIASLLATFSMLLAPRIESHMSFVKAITITRGITVPLMIAFPFVHMLYISVMLYIFYPMLRVIAIPIQQSAMLSMVPPEERGRISGYNQGSRLGFSSLGVVIGAPLMNFTSYYIPFISSSLLLAINVYLYNLFFSKGETKISIAE